MATRFGCALIFVEVDISAAISAGFYFWSFLCWMVKPAATASCLQVAGDGNDYTITQSSAGAFTALIHIKQRESSDWANANLRWWFIQKAKYATCIFILWQTVVMQYVHYISGICKFELSLLHELILTGSEIIYNSHPPYNSNAFKFCHFFFNILLWA